MSLFFFLCSVFNRNLHSFPTRRSSDLHTTRPPRGAEKNGQSYHFVSREEFEAMLGRGEFLEWAQVFGNYYGTHKGVLEKACVAGRDLVLDIDVQGARQLKAKIPEAVTVFVLAPSRQEFEN